MDAVAKQWLEHVSREAIEARESGNVARLSALSADPALKQYLENVVFLGTMTPDMFEHWYKPQMTRISDMAHAYHEAEQTKATVGGLESKIEKLTAMVEAMVATQTAKQKAQIAAALEAVEEPAEEAEQGPEADAPGDQPEGVAENAAADEDDEDDETDEEDAAA